MVKHLATLDEFKQALSSHHVVAVDFTATWCGPCRMIGPKFEEFAGQFTNVTCFKVDVDDNSDTAMEAKVSAMPTFKFYVDGKQADELVGADVNKLKALFEKYNSA